METRGRCGCGNVRFEVSGEPRQMFYCHCRSCQTAHAAPMLAAAVFLADQVTYSGELTQMTVTRGEGATPRFACLRCGTKVINVPHPSVRTILPSLCDDVSWFKPTLHMQWQDRLIDMQDDLPKYLDFPTQFGGTGKLA